MASATDNPIATSNWAAPAAEVDPDVEPGAADAEPTTAAEDTVLRRRLVRLNSDVEAAAATLRETKHLQTETVEAIERFVIAREAALEARLETAPAQTARSAPFVDAIAAAMAHLSEAPTNWHQSAAHFAALPPEDADAGFRVRAMLGSVLMVLAQCAVVVGVVVGTYFPSCASNDQCSQGYHQGSAGYGAGYP